MKTAERDGTLKECRLDPIFLATVSWGREQDSLNGSEEGEGTFQTSPGDWLLGMRQGDLARDMAVKVKSLNAQPAIQREAFTILYNFF